MNNPECIKFCNESLRPTADKLVAAYYAAKAMVQAYDATQLATKFGDDPTFSDTVLDGSDLDGRPPLTSGGVNLTITNIKALLTQLETVDAGTGLTLIQGAISISPRYNG